MSPHTAAGLTTTSRWHHALHTREEGGLSRPVMRERKFWPSVARVNNAHGDRNLVCTCPNIELYTEPVGV